MPVHGISGPQAPWPRRALVGAAVAGREASPPLLRQERTRLALAAQAGALRMRTPRYRVPTDLLTACHIKRRSKQDVLLDTIYVLCVDYIFIKMYGSTAVLPLYIDHET
ncbi:hypothetical protein NDU88_004264 [Pleurodeles waltl]|uniref:Uncharacterized protein n=1 Tax=Pleurodeles waltl TaxID=8319 RepID=A0AAV7SI95_PLEWA|nr:hypothetical protein NDU88_004264 [Pleurodeles waltl]